MSCLQKNWIHPVYNTVITSCSRASKWPWSIVLLEQLISHQNSFRKANLYSFNATLSACERRGLWDSWMCTLTTNARKSGHSWFSIIELSSKCMWERSRMAKSFDVSLSFFFWSSYDPCDLWCYCSQLCGWICLGRCLEFLVRSDEFESTSLSWTLQLPYRVLP